VTIVASGVVLKEFESNTTWALIMSLSLTAGALSSWGACAVPLPGPKPWRVLCGTSALVFAVVALTWCVTPLVPATVFGVCAPALVAVVFTRKRRQSFDAFLIRYCALCPAVYTVSSSMFARWSSGDPSWQDCALGGGCGFAIAAPIWRRIVEAAVKESASRRTTWRLR
jgi:hypothetical protein